MLGMVKPDGAWLGAPTEAVIRREWDYGDSRHTRTFRYLETFGLENCPPCSQALLELTIGLRGRVAHHCETPFSGRLL